MTKKFFGFTLSEVLIALGTIGVVAALVLPQLVTGERASTAKAQFNTAYSMISKTMTDLDIDNRAVNVSDFAAPENIYNKLKEYNRVTIDCGLGTPTSGNSVCPNLNEYKALGRQSSITGDLTLVGSFVINNGMAIAITTLTDVTTPLIFVDINGNDKKPNKFGYDFFGFEITRTGGITPIGTVDSFLGNNNPIGFCCNQLVHPGCTITNTNLDGFSCAIFAVSDEEYFKKIYKGY